MSKQTRRKFLIQVSKRNQPDIHSQEDPVNLIRERERTSETKIVERRYHLPVEVKEEMMVTIVTVIKTQNLESYGVLKPIEKL